MDGTPTMYTCKLIDSKEKKITSYGFSDAFTISYPWGLMVEYG